MTAAEAISWLNRGHQVQLVCEASPWPEGLADEDPRAAHFKRRSFAVMSGTMPTRVVVMLVANNAGACPNLLADMRCGIYEDRPLVCRIYPAEINPWVALNPAKKACPTEAWTANLPILQRNGTVMSDLVRRDIQSWRDADAIDVGIKSRLCVALNMIDAGLVHEAVLIYSPPIDTLRSALTHAMAADDGRNIPAQWRFVSDRAGTLKDVAAHGGVGLHIHDAETASYQHFNFEREALFGPYARRGLDL
ncbi:MAG: YkgJ family cysteine cluster protein [Pseudomonadota bacterium]|nr:YkgJ family cysteine cluster protein [Pseudomonadota bacterium]